MWFSYLPIIALVAGIVIAIFGAGPIGIVLAIIGIIGLVAKVAGSYAGQGRTSDQSGPEPVAGGHKATGHAHSGQEHMVP